MRIIHVILSGGVGSRLWPLSRKTQPKQYLSIFEGQTLFQKTILRNSQFSQQVLVVGNSDNYLLSREDLKNSGISEFSEIIEACPRNTAAAIAFAAFSANPDDILFITPSDQLIETGPEYTDSITKGITLAEEGFVVTFGLKPKRPETGFGYIEVNGSDVKSFREKPTKAIAEEFLKSGNFLWNSGIFMFKAAVFLEELELFEPEVFETSKIAFQAKKNNFLSKELSLNIPSISVDYAVMEKTKKIKVVASDFHWSDMGSFESIYEYFEKQGYPIDSNGNMVIGTTVFTEFIGLKNTLLIQTPDAILVLNKDNAQDVKKVFERLERDRPDLV